MSRGGEHSGGSSEAEAVAVGTLRPPATTEIESLGQSQAFDYFSPFRGARGSIKASLSFLNWPARDGLEVLTEEGVHPIRIVGHQAVEVLEAGPPGFGVHLGRAGRPAG